MSCPHCGSDVPPVIEAVQDKATGMLGGMAVCANPECRTPIGKMGEGRPTPVGDEDEPSPPSAPRPRPAPSPSADPLDVVLQTLQARAKLLRLEITSLQIKRKELRDIERVIKAASRKPYTRKVVPMKRTGSDH